MNRRCIFTLGFSLLIHLSCCCQSTLTKELKKQTIDTLAYALKERYAYKDLALQLSELLISNQAKGKYDKITDGEEFEKAITLDLRSLNHDKHLALNFDSSPATSPAIQKPESETAEQRLKRVSVFNRQMNFGFEKVQFFPGNIGYIKFNYFDAFPEYSKPVIDASFDFLKNSDAIIIDLKDNTGGASATVAYIAGLFFDTTTLIGNSYNRYTDSTTFEYLQPREKEHRLSKADLYILTSKTTVSGGEALAYLLKYMKGAKIIGETSAGAANPGRVIRINSFFTSFIPNRYSKNIVSQTSWEGTGVPVDIQVNPVAAIEKARWEALNTLKAKAEDSIAIRKYSAYVAYIKAYLNNKVIAEKEAHEYEGSYEKDRSVTYENGKLFYNGLAEMGGELIYLSNDVFMTAEGDVTITFIRNEQHKITALSAFWTLGSKPSISKKISK